MHNPPSPHISLGVDFGMKRIGLAVGQLITRSANPLTILDAQDGIPCWETVSEIIQMWRVKVLVVGIPYTADGSNQEITYAATKFARKLKARFKLPVHEIDERFTSSEARQRLQSRGKSAKGPIDSLAAKLILEVWLNSQPT